MSLAVLPTALVGAAPTSAPLGASTYLGGSVDDWGTQVDVLPDGSVVVVGMTDSSDFPGGGRGNPDIFVTRLKGDLSQVLWTFTTGGTGFDHPNAVRAGADAIYVAGLTESSDFPARGSIVFDWTFAGPSEGFLLKISPTGTFQWATYLGGVGEDEVADLDIDADGKVVAVGHTDSCDFPTTSGSAREPPADCAQMTTDGFVARFWPDGARNRVTLFGGSGRDSAEAVNVDAGTGSIMITGNTDSADLPVSATAFQKRPDDVFLATIDGGLTTVGATTYLGGTAIEQVFDLDRDAKGFAYVVGETQSGDFPATSTAAQPAHARTTGCDSGEGPGPCADGFAAKLSPALDTRVYGTYLGGTENDNAMAADVDSSGALHVAGPSVSTGWGGTGTSMGGTGVFAVTLSPDGSNFAMRTTFGGSQYDVPYGMRLGAGSLWITGPTDSPDFPTTSNALSRSLKGPVDGFVTRLDIGTVPPVLTFDHRAGNEWWVEVAVTGASVSAVESRDIGGAWVPLQLKSWGTWGASYHIEPGHDVQFRAFAGGAWVESCWFTHPAGVEKCAPQFFNPTVTGVKGNAWWIEATVSANEPIGGVAVGLNGGPPKPLDKTSWGTWAKSYAAPEGTLVQFYVSDTHGSTAVLNPCYRWVSATPVDCYTQPVVFDHRSGNEWWVEVTVTGANVQRVQAMDTGGAWTELTLRDWGAWAASFHLEPGHQVRFRAFDGSAWYESCWFTHPAGAASTGGATCVGTKTP